MTSLALLAATLLPLSAPLAHADEGFAVTSHRGLGISLGGGSPRKDKTAKVRTRGGDTIETYGNGANVTVNPQTGSISISSGIPAAPDPSAPKPRAPEAKTPRALEEPVLPQKIPLRITRGGKLEAGALIGGFIEIKRGSGIYVTARHVLQQLGDLQADAPSEVLEKAFAEAKVDFRKYEFLSAHDESGTLDAVLAAPAGSRASLARIFKESRAQLDFDLEFRSLQFGLQGARVTFQKSEGKGLVAFDDSYFYLPLSAANYSSPGSSGAPVFLRKAGGAWRLSGILECLAMPEPLATPPRQPTIRVLRVSAFEKAVFETLDPHDWIREPLKADPDCVPFGIRGGGGL